MQEVAPAAAKVPEEHALAQEVAPVTEE